MLRAIGATPTECTHPGLAPRAQEYNAFLALTFDERVETSMVLLMEETVMKPLRAIGAVSRWLFSTVLHVVGIQSHGVDPKGADYLFKPRPPEYRP